MLRGVNRQIVERLERAEALGPVTRSELEEALGSQDNHTRALKSIELIRKIWWSDPGLGTPPVVDIVHQDEQDHVFYPAYRDHVVHSLQVYLLGLDLYYAQPELREILEQHRSGVRFLRRWKVAALAHDHGYGGEVKGRFQVPEPLRRLLKAPLLAFQGRLPVGVQGRLGSYTTVRNWPADFLDELLEFEGERLLDRVVAHSGPTSLGAGDNPLQDYYDFAKDQGPGGRDHGIMGVLILLQLHRRLRSQLQGIQWESVPRDALTEREREFLKGLTRDMADAAEDVETACTAIAFHNIRRGVWSREQREFAAANFKLRLAEYRISLKESPLAWFLAFCDTLQCWNRPQAKGDARAADRFYPDERVELAHAAKRVLLRFVDEQEHLRATGESRFYQLRLELVDYLEEASIDAILGSGPSSDEIVATLQADPGSGESDPLRQLWRRPPNWVIMGEVQEDSDIRHIQREILGYKSAYPETLPVCVLYTGGSVGMVPKDEQDPRSPLVTKPVQHIIPYLGRMRELVFDIHFWQTPEPLDSSNIRPEDWVRIARIVQKLYSFYQGFVVLHGTDTMVYTASALSFIFRNLEKPVILTGAERPIAQLVTDAVPNIMNALQLAAPGAIGKPLVPEVCIYFGGKLIRGNRAKKTHSLAFAGFDSPNCELLGVVEDKIDIHTSLVRPVPIDPTGRTRPGQDLQLSVERLDYRVAIYEIYPSMTPCVDVLEYMLTKSDVVRAVVLKTYGTGNAPTLPERFLEVIEEGVKKHSRIIVNLTSCPVGQVEVRLFETNARLFELGVINGGDMTAEAAATKLMWLLAQHGRPGDVVDREAVIRDMQIDLRGELRFSVYNLVQKSIELTFDAYSPKSQYIGEIEPSKINHAYLRVHGIRLLSPAPQEFSLRLFFQSPQLTRESAGNWARRMIGEITRRWEGSEREQRDGITFNLDATQVVREQLRPQDQLSIQVLPLSAAPITIDTVELAIFTENRARVS
jgi:L-asparaginase